MLASIVIPFHNEEKNLQILLPHLETVLSDIENRRFEVLLVDDVSTDRSREYAERFCIDKLNWRVIALPERGGQTGCYKVAFEQASGEYILRMDSDLQDNPADLPLFVEKMEQGADLIMGLRECRKHRRMIRLASMIYDMMILLLFNTPLHSNSGSYVAFRSDLVRSLPWYKNDHRYLPLIAMRRGAKNIHEVFVRHSIRQYGESKYNPYLKIVKGLPEVFRFLIRLRMGIYDRIESD